VVSIVFNGTTDRYVVVSASINLEAVLNKTRSVIEVEIEGKEVEINGKSGYLQAI